MQNVPYVMMNQRFSQLPQFSVKTIGLCTKAYNAFPRGFQRLGNSYVAVYSSGPSHGNSDRIIWVRTDDEFETISTGVFYENATATYDLSFLSDLLAVGETVCFSSIWTIANEAGVLTPYVNSVITVTDPYALWGTPKLINGVWYTTGFRTSGGYRRVALFQSTDGMRSWQFKVISAMNNTKQLSEADIITCSNGDWVQITREDSATTDDLYRTVSTNQGTSWSAPVMLPSHVKGNQPQLIRHPDTGVLFLFVGIRRKSSAVTDYGNAAEVWDINGIGVHYSLDNGVTWSPVLMIAPMWSTDGGQPVPVFFPDGTIGVMFYTSCGATNISQTGVKTGVYFCRFRPDLSIF